MSERKYIILRIIFVISFILLFIILFAPNNKPVDVIKRKMDLILPSSAKILHFDFNRITGNFDAKIQINEHDIGGLRSELLKYFGQELFIESTDDIPNFQNTVAWWDMDKNNVVNCYYYAIDGTKHLFFSSPKMRDIWAFIVDQNDGEYYLYISYL